WHKRKALPPLLFDDEELEHTRYERDPETPAEPSKSANKKKHTGKTNDGLIVQSFDTLLANLGSRTRNRCRFKTDRADEKTLIYRLSELTPLQKKAYELLNIRTQ
ncbi:MAG: hypothetical protein JJU13_00745, partial [Balneolaceae bacterium]|nr:hypothetical protein [Balneolaceae bacterium]